MRCKIVCQAGEGSILSPASVISHPPLYYGSCMFGGGLGKDTGISLSTAKAQFMRDETDCLGHHGGVGYSGV
jgi:hypothetical protein